LVEFESTTRYIVPKNSKWIWELKINMLKITKAKLIYIKHCEVANYSFVDN